MTTKILASTDPLGNLVRFHLMPGQRFDTVGVASLIAAISGLRFRFAPPPSGYGGDEHNPLTNQSVHSVGADQTHAVALMDQAGWHTAGKRDVPANISIVVPPARCPELRPLENPDYGYAT